MNILAASLLIVGLQTVVGAIPADVPADATPAELVDRFEDPNVPTLRLAKQLDIAGRLVRLGDRSVLPRLEHWLTDEDRHVRGNAAFVFAGLGDERGLRVIGDMLTDFSDRPEGEGIAAASSDGRYHVSQQIEADRYYAVHLLGALKNPRAISLLVPLLDDPRLNYKVVWALGEIGGPTAIEAQDQSDDLVRCLRAPSRHRREEGFVPK